MTAVRAGTSILVAALLAGCGGERPRAGVPALEDEVRASSAAWDEAFDSGDLGRLMALYAEGAVSMPYGRPSIEGRAAIEEDFRAFFEAFDARHRTTIVELRVAGDWAIERGRYTMRATAKDGVESLEESGKHVVVRKRTDDGWRIVWEIWNLDAPTE